MSRYALRVLRVAARLDLLSLDEARAAVIHLATLLEQTQDVASAAYGSALLEAHEPRRRDDERRRWRGLADAIARLLAEQQEAAEGLASDEIVNRVRGARAGHDPSVLAQLSREALEPEDRDA